MSVFLFVLGLIDLGLIFFLMKQWRHMSVVGRVAIGSLVFAPMPLVYGLGVTLHSLNAMKSVEFCGSCHVMDAYIDSLHVEDAESIPAIHYQNNWVPQENACYDCHSEYSMFGDIKAKLNGLKHVYVNYVTGPPEEIELYQAYRNEDCLHCHGPAKNYQSGEDHVDNAEEIKTGETSCLDCHDVGHVLKKED
ncbi:MAG: NapC/NirT family cytochrome c [Acidobacteriota bacterium]|nr:NapC/NirT family cytochrome c [Acidobacteriota bacterium]